MEISAAFVVVVLAYHFVAVFTTFGIFLAKENLYPCAAATITHLRPYVAIQNITWMALLYEVNHKCYHSPNWDPEVYLWPRRLLASSFENNRLGHPVFHCDIQFFSACEVLLLPLYMQEGH